MKHQCPQANLIILKSQLTFCLDYFCLNLLEMRSIAANQPIIQSTIIKMFFFHYRQSAAIHTFFFLPLLSLSLSKLSVCIYWNRIECEISLSLPLVIWQRRPSAFIIVPQSRSSAIFKSYVIEQAKGTQNYCL